MNERILGMIIKYKKPLLIIGFLFGYILFWWWFFGEKNIAIEEDNIIQSNEIVKKEDNEEGSVMIDGDEKQFTEFGNFWLQIDTDSVNIKAPIVNGVTDEKLAEGVGHHKTTAFPNSDGGNVVLSGHRWKFGKNPAYKVFENIDELKIGDNVTVHYRGKDFVYKIIEQKIVDDKSIDILEQTNESMLTFYTCTPKYTSFKRLVYRAKLVDIFDKRYYDEDIE